MPRYIDAEKLAEKIIEDKVLFIAKEDLPRDGYVFQTLFADLSEVVSNIPTADVVEVVRCKDCRHYYHYGLTSLLVDGKNIKCGWCQRRIRCDEEYRMLATDFCSYGERKTDDNS